MSLVERIQDLCGSKNTTLIGLEREIGLGRGTIRNWDKNSPSVDKVQRWPNTLVSPLTICFTDSIKASSHRLSIWLGTEDR